MTQLAKDAFGPSSRGMRFSCCAHRAKVFIDATMKPERCQSASLVVEPPLRGIGRRTPLRVDVILGGRRGPLAITSASEKIMDWRSSSACNHLSIAGGQPLALAVAYNTLPPLLRDERWWRSVKATYVVLTVMRRLPRYDMIIRRGRVIEQAIARPADLFLRPTLPDRAPPPRSISPPFAQPYFRHPAMKSSAASRGSRGAGRPSGSW